MSALQQVMDCQDLKRFIREYLPPHPIAIIIEEEYLTAFSRDMYNNCKKIVNNARLYEIKDGNYKIVFEFEKDLIDDIEKRITNKIFHRPNYWNVNWIVINKIKRLIYIQDKLELTHPTYFTLFKFKKDDGMTNMIFSVRSTCEDNYTQLMRDYYEIYKAYDYWFIDDSDDSDDNDDESDYSDDESDDSDDESDDSDDEDN